VQVFDVHVQRLREEQPEVGVWRVQLESGTPGLPHRVTREEIFVVVSGSTLVLPAGVELALETGAEALVCLPIGGQGVVGDAAPFTPPWAE